MQIIISSLIVIWFVLIYSLRGALFFYDEQASFNWLDGAGAIAVLFNLWIYLFFTLFIVLPFISIVVLDIFIAVRLFIRPLQPQKLKKLHVQKFIVTAVFLLWAIFTQLIWHLSYTPSMGLTTAGLAAYFAPLLVILALATVLFVLEIQKPRLKSLAG